MATVRFSKELCEQILQNAKASFARQVDELSSFQTTSLSGDEIYYATLGAHHTIMDQLPMEYFQVIDTIRIRSVAGINIDTTFQLSGKRRWPYHIAKDNAVLREYEGYGGGYVASTDAFWLPLTNEAKAWMNKRNAVIAKRNEFADSVKRVISAYSTLAPALKAWPPLWDLIPENYKEKHREVVEREKREVEVSVDLTRLTALATQAKFHR